MAGCSCCGFEEAREGFTVRLSDLPSMPALDRNSEHYRWFVEQVNTALGSPK
ncbi:hypothetical protein [Streptomyces sp. CB02923]|uniref:hypothetical protein n=1 Tax=Streptomyces sp. CB02923 TaxID=1718985 RepID=UPI001900623A|nr:hypothetical protein [Streptomyces sp. CB02923]